MQVFFFRSQGEGVDGESAFLHAHLQVTAGEQPCQTFVPAAKIEDDGVGAVFLQVREQKIQEEALSCAGCPKNDGVRVVLIVQIQVVRSALIRLQDREVFLIE